MIKVNPKVLVGLILLFVLLLFSVGYMVFLNHYYSDDYFAWLYGDSIPQNFSGYNISVIDYKNNKT